MTREEAILAQFDWTNEDWAEAWLPWIRVAAVITADDEAPGATLANDPNLREGLAHARAHLATLHSLLTTALKRLDVPTEH
jgi:hypothetical protein